MKITSSSLAVLLVCLGSLSAQNLRTDDNAKPAPTTIRVWISDKSTGTVQGGIASTDLLKQISEKCQGVVLTDTVDRADYRLEADRAWCCTPKGESRGYKFALFNRDGDAVFSTKTHELKNAVKDLCAAIGHGKSK